MNLQPLTLSVLDNYKDINSKIIFNEKGEGFLALANETRTVITYFELSEDEKKIPEFGIYDLGSLLKIFDAMKSNEGFDLRFEEKFLVMKTDVSQVKYFYSAMDLLTKPPPRKSIDVEPTFSFLLKSSDIEKLKTMSKLMSIEHVQIEIKEKNTIGIIKAVSNETSNVFKLVLGKCNFPNYPAVTWKLENWKMMKGVDYKMSFMAVNDKKISKFEAVDGDGKSLGLIYYVAVEAE
jgi:hypothetical protein